MTIQTHHGGWVIAATFALALVLSILPMPGWTVLLRPEWVAMVLVYWCIALPQRAGVGVGWLAGLALDVLRGALLGQHALGFTIIAYLSGKLHRQLRVFPPWQQAFSVAVLIALNQTLVLWIAAIAGEPRAHRAAWLPVLTSALLWPPLFLVLRGLRRRFHVK